MQKSMGLTRNPLTGCTVENERRQRSGLAARFSALTIDSQVNYLQAESSIAVQKFTCRYARA